MISSQKIQRNLPPAAAAVRNIIIFITVLSIPLATAQTLELSPAQTSSWILALYGIPSILSLILAVRYRQPLVLTGNLFIILFVSRLGEQFSFPELVGASIVAGAAVVGITVLGLSGRLAAWIPMPVVFGLLAGTVTPFVSGIFTEASTAPLLVGGTFLVYLASRRFLGERVPAIFPGLIAGIGIAFLTNQVGQAPASFALVAPEITIPQFTLPAVIAIVPVFVILIILQANLPSLLYLRSQGYHPPESTIYAASGFGTLLGSLLGPTGISLSLPVTSLVAGEEAGEHAIRHRSVYLAGAVALLVGLLAGIAADLASMIPSSLLLSLAGLAVFDVFLRALSRVIQGPLVIGPLFAFATALSQISLLGFGPFFWALIIGTGVSYLLERDGLKRLRQQEEVVDESRS